MSTEELSRGLKSCEISSDTYVHDQKTPKDEHPKVIIIIN